MRRICRYCCFHLGDLHALLHATQEHSAFVTVEIVAGGIAQDRGNLAELVAFAAIAHAHRHRMTEAVVTPYVRSDACSHLWQRQDVVGDGSRIAGAAQIQPMQRDIVHGQRQAAAFLDRCRAQRAVAVETPHDQADHIAVLIVRHRHEKTVDQPVVAFAVGQCPQADTPFLQRDHGIGGGG